MDEILEIGSKQRPIGLLDELAESGVKYNPEDIVMITKTPDGKLMWLETENSKV